MKTKTYTRTVAEVPDVGDLDISPFSNLDESVFEPEFHINQANPNEAALLFTQYDEDCENPLDNCDGMGKIHHRPRSNYGRRDGNEYYAALGLNSYGDHNLDAIYDNHFAELSANYIERVLREVPILELTNWADENYERVEEDESSNTVFVRNCLKEDLKINLFRCEYANLLENSVEEMFDNPKYFPGNPFAFLLDVYEHSGRSYSLSGGGMQCRWDTSRGEAIWVPDECLLHNILKDPRITDVSSVYEWQPAEPFENGAGQYGPDGAWKKYVCVTPRRLEFDGKKVADYEVILAKLWAVYTDEQRAELTQLMYERAKSCVAEYDAWQRGDCHYQVCIKFAKDGEGWEQVDYDTCGGYVGSKYAEEARYDCVPSWVSEQLKEQTT